MKKSLMPMLFLLYALSACKPATENAVEDVENKISSTVLRNFFPADTLSSYTGKLEKNLIAAGLVNIKDIDSTVAVDLKYSTADNFLSEDVYGELENCYLQKDVAEKVALAQLLLKSKYPYYRLVIFDGARPVSVQKAMWDMLKMPPGEKTKYLSNPASGSLHNYGAAVDISIVDQEGKELDMGTKFDYFGELAYPEKEEELNIKGELSFQQISNRKLLRSVMQQSGFFNIETEWWHFNSCTRAIAAQKYTIIP